MCHTDRRSDGPTADSRPPNTDTISRLFSPPFPTFRRSLSLRPVGGQAIIGSSSEVVVGGWLQLDTRHEASGGGVEVEGTGADDRFPTGADVWRRLPVEKCELIACAVERSPICMDRGEGEREGRERGETLILFVDAK